MLLLDPDSSLVGLTYRAMLNILLDDVFMYMFGAPTFFKKVQLKCLKGATKMWYGFRSLLRISYYSNWSLVWDSPGTPECLLDSLAKPPRDS